MEEDKFKDVVIRHTALGLAIAELIYKVVQVAIATAVVAFAADKTGSYTLYMMVIALITVLAIYSIAVPMRVVELLTPEQDADQPRGWIANLGTAVVLVVVAAFAISTFNLIPDIIRYMNEAAHPSTAAIATQH